MPTHATCEFCASKVDDVRCAEHTPLKCDECKQVGDRLLCENCAEDEFGDDGSARAPTDEDVADLLEHAVISDDVGDLAAAIRRGDRDEAEYLLDKIAALVPSWSDRVSLGRYSPLARAA